MSSASEAIPADEDAAKAAAVFPLALPLPIILRG
jgi:hypothetical protein